MGRIIRCPRHYLPSSDLGERTPATGVASRYRSAMDGPKPYFPAPRPKGAGRDSDTLDDAPRPSPPYRAPTPPTEPRAAASPRGATPVVADARALKNAFIEELAAARTRRIRAAQLQMAGGFALFAGGIIVTLASGGAAIFYGAMVVGVLTLFRGVVAWISALG